MYDDDAPTGATIVWAMGALIFWIIIGVIYYY